MYLAIITITFANGQTILPVASTEMCPNQEYTFTVSLPADYISLNSSGGAQITLFPSTLYAERANETLDITKNNKSQYSVFISKLY